MHHHHQSLVFAAVCSTYSKFGLVLNVVRVPHDTNLRCHYSKMHFINLAVLLLSSGWASVFCPSSMKTTRASSLFSTVEEAPVKEAPGAGWEPEWEGRTGLEPEEFMQSDMSKHDLGACGNVI
jgi:hypothetical protein